MDKNNGIYDMIAERTNGDVYIGVVGPVRCGKSTFITKFMQSFVLPNIQNVNDRIRATDELPQASEGKTVMTTQPKFVPNEAIKLKLGKVALNLRMIDCVGFMVDGAMGHFEDDKPRLVQTPWSDEKIPFTQAAALGTQKVINEHSTVAVVMTTDGSFTNIDRENYALTEKKVIDQVKASQKPFVIVLNTSKPNAEATKKLVAKLQENYQAPVMALDVVNLDSADIDSLMAELLMQFPIEAINIKLPNWLRALPYEHPIINEIIVTVKEKTDNMQKIGEFTGDIVLFENSEHFEPILTGNIQMGQGTVEFEIVPKSNLFYVVLSYQCGCEITNDYELISYLKELTFAKSKYDKIRKALDQVEQTGYGIVIPTMDEMELMEPQIMRQGSRCGVKLRATAPSLHIMRVDVETEVSPLMGSEAQSEDLAQYLLKEFENDPQGIWQTNMFGKSLESLVNEGLNSKLNSMPEPLQNKMRRTLTRIINEGKGGVICILL